MKTTIYDVSSVDASQKLEQLRISVWARIRTDPLMKPLIGTKQARHPLVAVKWQRRFADGHVNFYTGSSTGAHFSSGISRLSKNLPHRNSIRNGDKLIRFGIELKCVSVSFASGASYSFHRCLTRTSSDVLRRSKKASSLGQRKSDVPVKNNARNQPAFQTTASYAIFRYLVSVSFLVTVWFSCI